MKYGKLVAYRMDDERELSRDKFVWVDVDRPEQAGGPNTEDSVAR